MNQHDKIFTTKDGQAQLEVVLEQESAWLRQAQMGELFGTTPENILMHLRNIFNEDELDENRTTKDFLIVRKEGQRRVRRTYKALQP